MVQVMSSTGVFFVAGNLCGFDAGVVLPSDGNGEPEVLEGVADRIGDHGVGNDLEPVIKGGDQRAS